jgi:hypothetical protein
MIDSIDKILEYFPINKNSKNKYHLLLLYLPENNQHPLSLEQCDLQYDPSDLTYFPSNQIIFEDEMITQF